MFLLFCFLVIYFIGRDVEIGENVIDINNDFFLTTVTTLPKALQKRPFGKEIEYCVKNQSFVYLRFSS